VGRNFPRDVEIRVRDDHTELYFQSEYRCQHSRCEFAHYYNIMDPYFDRAGVGIWVSNGSREADDRLLRLTVRAAAGRPRKAASRDGPRRRGHDADNSPESRCRAAIG